MYLLLMTPLCLQCYWQQFALVLLAASASRGGGVWKRDGKETFTTPF